MNFLQRLVPWLAGGGFLLFLVGYTLYSTYAIHHLNEFGYSGDASQRMLRVYILLAATLSILTIVAVVIGVITL